MKTKIVVEERYGKPYQICIVKEVSTNEYLQIEKECVENQQSLENVEKLQREKIAYLENEILKLKYDIKLLKGEISEGEYEQLCLGLMK